MASPVGSERSRHCESQQSFLTQASARICSAYGPYRSGVDGKPSVYVINSSSELTRYDVRPDGRLAEGATLSFLSSGVTAGLSERSVFFISDD